MEIKGLTLSYTKKIREDKVLILSNTKVTSEYRRLFCVTLKLQPELGDANFELHQNDSKMEIQQN